MSSGISNRRSNLGVRTLVRFFQQFAWFYILHSALCIFFIAAAAIGAAWYGLVVYVCAQLIHPPRRPSAYWRSRMPYITPAEAGMTFEEWRIPTRDGLHLNAWFIPAATSPAKGTVIYLHGIGGSRVTTITGCAMFVSHGYNMLAYDSRGSGDSEGDCCTYGFYEKLDLQDAVDFLMTDRRVDAQKIAALGKSMGGAIALQAAEIEPRLRCVIAEASFADLRSVARDYQRRKFGIVAALVESAALRRAESRAKFDIDAVSPRSALQHANTPVLIIHGADDPLVDSRYAQMLFDAASGPKELWIIPQGGHTDLRSTAGDEYDLRRLRFLEQHGL